jgi:small subunit ribosomal protein S9
MPTKKTTANAEPKTRFAPKPTMKKTTARKPAAKKAAPKKAAAAHAVTASHPAPVRHIKHTYIFAVGRRKEAVARVRWHQNTGNGEIIINERPMDKYFPTLELQNSVRDPFVLTHQENFGSVTVKVAGGGTQGQADAVRLGIARALVKVDPDVRLTLKRAGYLRRDPRVKERKKYGLKRARRAPQWQKR